MKRQLLSMVLCLALVIIVGCGTAVAAIRANALTLTPFGGWLQPESNSDLEGGATGGLSVGYNFSDKWAGELTGSYTDTETTFGALRTQVFTARADVLRHFLSDKSFVPFLALGGGYYGTEIEEYLDSELVADYGVGFKLFLSDSLAFRIDVRHLFNFNLNDLVDDRTYYNVLLATAGLAWQFYGSESLEKLSNDTDADGIVNAYDRCPNTKAGETVDPSGCVPDPQLAEQLRLGREVANDSDLDGVPNRVDRCPNTPPKMAVNSLGCPADSDGDGIFDVDDKCPDTPQGTIINAAGCSAGMPAMNTKVGGIVLNLEFLPKQADILPEFDADLAKAAHLINMHPQELFLIDGHTDSVGPDDSNVALSLQRAEKVRDYLVSRFGLAPERLVARGFGEKQPLADNATQEGRKQNRRVVIIPAAR